MRDKERALVQLCLQKARESSPDASLVEEYILIARNQQIASEAAVAALDVASGDGSLEKLKDLISKLEVRELKEDGFSFITNDLNEILNKQVIGGGLKWGLDCLNRSLGPLRTGDFGFLFKRPESGGTTFLASQVSSFAKQVDRPIVWINNEEQGEKVMLRCYEAILGCKVHDLFREPEAIHKRFLEAGGSNIYIPTNIKLNHRDISILCRNRNPSLVIIDQLDKVEGFEGERKDLEHGARYRWARELAKEFCPVIGVCQASGEAENKMWLQMDDIAESKTTKAAEADWIIGMGRIDEDGKRNFRYLNVVKNKLIGDKETLPEERHGRFQVIIKPEIARFEDIYV